MTVVDGVSGRVILVTGSSRGIGRAIARALAEAGARVVITGLHAERAEEFARSLPEQAIGIGADLSVPGEPEKLVEETLKRAGRLDGLVNNAGLSLIQSSAETTRTDWSRILDLNLTASFFCSQAAAAAFSGQGVILNVASIAGLTGLPGRSAYAASKAALIALTKVLAVEWAPRIRVNAIAPGYVRTDAMNGLIEDGKIDALVIEKRTPARRFGLPEEIANASVFLLGNGASFVTGEILAVDGGWLANGEPPRT